MNGGWRRDPQTTGSSTQAYSQLGMQDCVIYPHPRQASMPNYVTRPETPRKPRLRTVSRALPSPLYTLHLDRRSLGSCSDRTAGERCPSISCDAGMSSELLEKGKTPWEVAYVTLAEGRAWRSPSGSLFGKTHPRYVKVADHDCESPPPPRLAARLPSARRRWLLLGLFALLTIFTVFVHLVRGAKQAGFSKRKALIIAGYGEQDHSWFPEIPPDWEFVTYVLDNPLNVPAIPRQNSNEAMAYTSYMIDNYHNLPDYMVFIHGHNKAWHQPEPIDMIIKALNLEAVDEHGWVSLRCQLEAMCEPESTRANMSFSIRPIKDGPKAQNWPKLHIMRSLYQFVFRQDDPWYDDSDHDERYGTPAYFASPCCAQFAVSKKQALKRPLEFWKRLREPLEKDLTGLIKTWNLPEDTEPDWWLGTAYETMWHYFFAMDAVTCLDRTYCREVVYGNRIHCDGHTTHYKASQWYNNITCVLDEP